MLVQDAFRIGYEAVRSLADKLVGRTPAQRLEDRRRLHSSADEPGPHLGGLGIRGDRASIRHQLTVEIGRRWNPPWCVVDQATVRIGKD